MQSSHRQRIISLVESAVVFYNRAVKLIDLQEYARSLGQMDLCDERLSTCLARLVYNGEIYIAKQGRKDKYGGNFYLPTGVAPEGYVENLPLSWLDVVWQSFEEIWENRTSQALAEGVLPTPVSTEEVEAYILEKFGKETIPQDESPIAYALGYLCKPKPTAVLKKLRRATYGRCLWIPTSVSPNEYELKGRAKNKSETINLLVQKAVEHFNRPVTADEISKTAKLFPHLNISGQMWLNDLVNETKFSRIKQIAATNGEWYYFFGEISEGEIQSFVLLRNSERQWQKSNTNERLNLIRLCKLPSVIFGRMLLLKETISRLLFDLKNFCDTENFDETNRFSQEIISLFKEIKNVLLEVETELNEMAVERSSLPHKINGQKNLLDSTEITNYLKPFLTKVKEADSEARTADLIGRQIKKHFNHQYKPTFAGKSNENAVPRYLFDKFDLITYTAQQIGGNLCRALAIMAQSEMGELRDGRFLLPMLESENYEHRLGATVCLAFLQNSEYEKHIYDLAILDKDAGVRKIALWAYIFMQGNSFTELIAKIKECETHKQVLEFITRIEEIGVENVWFT